MFQKIDPYSVILHKILKVPTPFVSKLYNVPNISWPVVDMCVCVLSIIQLHQSLLNQHITHCYNSYTTHTWCSKIIPSISLKQSGIGYFLWHPGYSQHHPVAPSFLSTNNAPIPYLDHVREGNMHSRENVFSKHLHFCVAASQFVFTTRCFASIERFINTKMQ